jgi:hypothetical protein
MTEVSQETIQQLWYATPESNWDSLRQGLGTIYQRRVISVNAYEEMNWAIDRLQKLGVDFPSSPGELQMRIDPYI